MINLSNFGLKHTKTREQILLILQNSKDPLTAEEIYHRLNDNEVNLSTVYRTLTSFVEVHILEKDIHPDGKALYSIEKENHQHVLICIQCNKRIYLDSCPYHTMAKEIYDKTGFTIQNHAIELYGLCSECKRKRIN